MQTHQMRLHPEHFKSVKDGNKTIEIRLNDPKRQLIEVGDTIEFLLRPELTERLQAKITDKSIFKTFKEAYEAYPSKQYGASSATEWERMYDYYTPEDEAEFGVLSLHLQVSH